MSTTYHLHPLADAGADRGVVAGEPSNYRKLGDNQ